MALIKDNDYDTYDYNINIILLEVLSCHAKAICLLHLELSPSRTLLSK